MCVDPITVAAAATTALSATQSVVSYMGGVQEANAHNAYRAQNAANSIDAYSDDIEAINLEAMSRQEDSTIQRLMIADQGLAARASARVSAGERGLGGITAAALEQDVGFWEGTSIVNLDRNDELDAQRHRLSARGARNTALSRINSVRAARRPSLLALGASLGQSAVQGFTMHSHLSRLQPPPEED